MKEWINQYPFFSIRNALRSYRSTVIHQWTQNGLRHMVMVHIRHPGQEDLTVLRRLPFTVSALQAPCNHSMLRSSISFDTFIGVFGAPGRLSLQLIMSSTMQGARLGFAVGCSIFCAARSICMSNFLLLSARRLLGLFIPLADRVWLIYISFVFYIIYHEHLLRGRISLRGGVTLEISPFAMGNVSVGLHVVTAERHAEVVGGEPRGTRHPWPRNAI